jgi:hypothetical protein
MFLVRPAVKAPPKNGLRVGLFYPKRITLMTSSS